MFDYQNTLRKAVRAGHAAALQQTAEQLERARAVLRELEWSDYNETGVGPLAQDFCPTCGEHKSNGHADDCALAAVLK